MSTQGHAATGPALADLRLADRELWGEGPPLEVFRDLRRKCPVHWSSGMSEYAEEPGFWSITTQEDIRTISRDWQTFSSELGGITVNPAKNFPLEAQTAMFIGWTRRSTIESRHCQQATLRPADRSRDRSRGSP